MWRIPFYTVFVSEQEDAALGESDVLLVTMGEALAAAAGVAGRRVIAVLAHVKAGVEGIEILGVQVIQCETQGFPETGRLK